jgi:hypothetical protein
LLELAAMMAKPTHGVLDEHQLRLSALSYTPH